MAIDIEGLPAGLDAGVADTIARLSACARGLAARIAAGGLDEELGTVQGGENADGDAQKALDVIADEAFAAALAGGSVRYYASEEQDDAVEIEAGGTLALAIDPLDGSSNIDTNVSIGTIFGIYPAAGNAASSFLRRGRDLLASGYFVYGPKCALVVTFGDGTLQFVLDAKSGRFRPAGAMGPIPAEAKEFAINASNARHWFAPVRAYIDSRQAGAEGPAGKNYNMRWVGSLVAEAHRILTRGGVFLYPGDARAGYATGRLRLVYECAPIGFLIEQAGGTATDGQASILDAVPDGLHARVPLVFGSADEVAEVARLHG